MIDLTDVTNLATVIDWQWVKQWWIGNFSKIDELKDDDHDWYDWYDWYDWCS